MLKTHAKSSILSLSEVWAAVLISSNVSKPHTQVRTSRFYNLRVFDRKFRILGYKIHTSFAYSNTCSRTAICPGAVFKGFLDLPQTLGSATDTMHLAHVKSPLSVISTVARQSIGMLYWAEFIEGVHSVLDKIRDENEGIYRADNQTRWYLRKVCASLDSLMTPLSKFNTDVDYL